MIFKSFLISLIFLLMVCMTGCSFNSQNIKKQKTQATLEWSWNGDHSILQGYNVYRKILGKECSFVKVNDQPIKTEFFTDHLPETISKTVCYRVTAQYLVNGNVLESLPSKIKCTNIF